MSEDTNIGWCDHTASRWMGCTRRSEGCIFCYIPETPPLRRVGYQLGQPRIWVKGYDANCAKWNKRAELSGKPESVFGSLHDWLDDQAPIAWLASMLGVIYRTPHLRHLLLTKRPELFFDRMRAALNHNEEQRGLNGPAAALDLTGWLHNWIGGHEVPRNVWMGVTCENQKRADERIPILLSIPASARWISAEPLLEPLEFSGERLEWLSPFKETDAMLRKTPKIDWVVVGGESGSRRRDCGVDAIASVAEQCKAAGVPVFVKQDCAQRSGQQGRIPADIWTLKQFPA